MKARFLGFLLIAALALPAGARPLSTARPVTAWASLWHDFLGILRGFRLFDACDAGGTHGFPPPTTTTTTLFQ